jgi:hypothetical protein
MKCIRCGIDNNLKDRTGNYGRCKNCEHPFVFEPNIMGKISLTDSFFQKVLQDISVNNTLFFTPKQLLYLLDQRLKNKGFSAIKYGSFFGIFIYLFFNVWATGFIGGFLSFVVGKISFILVPAAWNAICIYILFQTANSPTSNLKARKNSSNLMTILGIFIAVFGTLYSAIKNSPLGFVLTIILSLTALWLSYFQKRRNRNVKEEFLITPTHMETWLNQWQSVNGIESKMLPNPNNSLPVAPANPEVVNYSFDRLVVCQSEEIAQILIANNFHFENNCAVLSISGYPQSIFATTMTMLRRNPELKVFAFHNCSPDGLTLVQELRTNPEWFPDPSIAIIDVGLSPRQILAAQRGIFIQNSPTCAQAAQVLDPSIKANLTTEELKWLELGNFVELESFTPQKLLQVLSRTISNSQQLTVVDDSSFILIGDSGTSFYTSESFG